MVTGMVSDMDAHKMLVWVIKYLMWYREMPLTIEADNTHVVKWWFDAEFAVHSFMKSHTLVIISLVKVKIYSTLVIQNLNTNISRLVPDYTAHKGTSKHHKS